VTTGRARASRFISAVSPPLPCHRPAHAASSPGPPPRRNHAAWPQPARSAPSYAHEDSKWCEAILNHVGWLRHSGQVEAFHDRALKPGERWDDRIKRELAASEIVIALVSPHFMGSRYCCLDELQPAIDRQDRGEADLVPIVYDHVDLGPLPTRQ
jgi:hypothetical protein